MLFETDLDLDGRVYLTVALRTPVDRYQLYVSKPKQQPTEEEIIAAIVSNKTAMSRIKFAAKRGHVLFDDDTFVVPVTLTVTLNNSSEQESREAELWIPTEPVSVADAQQSPKTASVSPAVTADCVQFLKSLHDMSITTIGLVAKSAQESIARVAQSQTEALKALSSSLQEAQKTTERLGSLPSKIFEQSTDQVEALVALAQERAATKHGESAQQKDVVSELKDLIGLIQTMKGAFNG